MFACISVYYIFLLSRPEHVRKYIGSASCISAPREMLWVIHKKSYISDKAATLACMRYEVAKV
jgi:hypothetical protein